MQEPINTFHYAELSEIAGQQPVNRWKADLIGEFYENSFLTERIDPRFALLRLLEIGRIIGIREERQRKKPLKQSHLPQPIV